MSILIKGVTMPKNCFDCPMAFAVDFGILCTPTNYIVGDNEISKKQGFCPLVHVPPHGRLIDAAEITEHKYTTIPSHRKEYADGKPKSDEEIIAFKLGWNYAIDAIVENASTIIPESDKDTNVLGKEEGET